MIFWEDRAQTDILSRCCEGELLDKDEDVSVLGLGIDSLYELGMRGIEWLDRPRVSIKEMGQYTHEGVGLEETRPILFNEKKICHVGTGNNETDILYFPNTREVCKRTRYYATHPPLSLLLHSHQPHSTFFQLLPLHRKPHLTDANIPSSYF